MASTNQLQPAINNLVNLILGPPPATTGPGPAVASPTLQAKAKKGRPSRPKFKFSRRTSRVSFLGLAPEIRNIIYDYALRDYQPRAVKHLKKNNGHYGETGLLDAHHQIYHDVVLMFYKESTFAACVNLLEDDEWSLDKALAYMNSHLVRAKSLDTSIREFVMELIGLEWVTLPKLAALAEFVRATGVLIAVVSLKETKKRWSVESIETKRAEGFTIFIAVSPAYVRLANAVDALVDLGEEAREADDTAEELAEDVDDLLKQLDPTDIFVRNDGLRWSRDQRRAAKNEEKRKLEEQREREELQEKLTVAMRDGNTGSSLAKPLTTAHDMYTAPLHDPMPTESFFISASTTAKHILDAFDAAKYVAPAVSTAPVFDAGTGYPFTAAYVAGIGYTTFDMGAFGAHGASQGDFNMPHFNTVASDNRMYGLEEPSQGTFGMGGDFVDAFVGASPQQRASLDEDFSFVDWSQCEPDLKYGYGPDFYRA